MPQQASQFIHLSDAEKNELILRTSSNLGISPILIEKDFWVSWLLNTIFGDEISKNITFKGGTSLSKCYSLISRFSEDIDLTIDRKLFADSTNEESLSGKAFQRSIESVDMEANKFVQEIFRPWLENTLGEFLVGLKWELQSQDQELKNLRFYYPSTQKRSDNPYINQSVLIEFGVRGRIEPFETKFVSSYVDQQFSGLLHSNRNNIRTLSPLRTFWEKATLLHAENNRPRDKTHGDRLSRHYYDIYQLIKGGISEQALQELPLLYDVIDHKRKYFRVAWAKYEEAVPKTILLTPHKDLSSLLETDYKQMQGMLFGEAPGFSDIIKSISSFENELRQLA